MIIEQKDVRRVQSILLGILSFLWVILILGVWHSSARSGFDALFILISTPVAAGIVLFFLARKWEGVVVSQSEKIEYLKNPDSVDDRVDVHFAKIRLASGRMKRVRLGSNTEVLARLNVVAGDRLIKRRWALFCVVEKQ